MTFRIKRYRCEKDKQSLEHDLYKINLEYLLNYKKILIECEIRPYGHSFYCANVFEITKHYLDFALFQKLKLKQILMLDNILFEDFIVVDKYDLEIICNLLKMTPDVSEDPS